MREGCDNYSALISWLPATLLTASLPHASRLTALHGHARGSATSGCVLEATMAVLRPPGLCDRFFRVASYEGCWVRACGLDETRLLFLLYPNRPCKAR
jgi:hypothetical protein